MTEINETIEAVKDQYSATPYSRENINQTAMENLQLMISDQLFLNVTLVEINKTISYSSYNKKEDMKKAKCLEEEIQRMENNIHKLEEDKQVLRSRKENLFNLRKAKMELLSKDANILTNTEDMLLETKEYYEQF